MPGRSSTPARRETLKRKAKDSPAHGTPPMKRLRASKKESSPTTSASSSPTVDRVTKRSTKKNDNNNNNATTTSTALVPVTQSQVTPSSSRPRPTTFSQLCVDLLLDVFGYFTFGELLNSFPLLVPNLLAILHESHARLHIASMSLDVQKMLEQHLEFSQVSSLVLEGNAYRRYPLHEFTRLRSLTLPPWSSRLFPLESELNKLPLLQRLVLHFPKERPAADNNRLLRFLCGCSSEYPNGLPSLKRLELHADGTGDYFCSRHFSLAEDAKSARSQRNSATKQPTTTTVTKVDLVPNSNITHFYVTGQSYWSTIDQFLRRMPRLRVLRATGIRRQYNDKMTNGNPAKLPDLHSVDVGFAYYFYSQTFRKYLAGASNLRRLSLVHLKLDIDEAMEPGRWRLMAEQWPQLKKVDMLIKDPMWRKQQDNVKEPFSIMKGTLQEALPDIDVQLSFGY